ncbi:MAG TPA: phospholipase domain-containing protein, partial [Luteimonas sp.]|nr:phospholipase domain-containing protein [Luteimonas sp.]
DAACKLAPPRASPAASMPRQEPGRRPARALPYVLHVHGRTQADTNEFVLDFVNAGAAGAGFNVYSGRRGEGPWFYTVESGKRLSDEWAIASNGGYDLRAFGPNGFLREFKGDPRRAGRGGARPEAEADYDAVGGRLILRLRNDGEAACLLTVAVNRYGNAPAREHILAPGARIEDAWPIAASDHWYDVSVTSDSDRAYLRRFAGHVETGASSYSDPAIGA